MPQKKTEDPIVIKIYDNGIQFDAFKMKKSLSYPFEFYGMKMSVQKIKFRGFETLQINIDEYPKNKVKQKYYEVKHSSHITQNGCKCKKCISLTKQFKRLK